MKWYFWVFLTMAFGIATGITGDLHLHNTQVALAFCTAGSGIVAFGMFVGMLTL